MHDIRLFSMIWGPSVDDYADLCLPSLLQPNNIPWLLNNGYRVHFDVFTLDVDQVRVSRLIAQAQEQLGYAGAKLQVKINVWTTAERRPSNEELKTTFFNLEMQTVVETKMKVMFTNADLFFGDGSVRNAVVYAQSPRVAVCGTFLRVDRDDAVKRIKKLRQITGSSVVSNAQLVDISLHTMIPGLRASIVDNPENASLHTSASMRKITDNLYTLISQLPTPWVVSFDASDRSFLSYYGAGRLEAIDHLWAAKLIAEHRWRVLGSSDMFFCAEFTPRDVAMTAHSYPVESNSLYNEEFTPETQHSRLNQCFVTVLRAEPTFTDDV